MNNFCKPCLSKIRACKCTICKEKNGYQLCLKCNLKISERKRLIKSVDKIVLIIYDVLEIQGLLLSNLSHETQKKVRQLERFYKHKEIVKRVYLNDEDEIPSYQIPN
ncbi:unnamed protein product [Brachionus calyciflorus]|uniref:Uncharacterized protein n=1 Tax=Brachionus calyciflorus TaxID=104777 RepID=A0A814PES7_9BILA|nr:unnamed protein product [Brachionus calyciflorus]